MNKTTSDASGVDRNIYGLKSIDLLPLEERDNVLFELNMTSHKRLNLISFTQ